MELTEQQRNAWDCNTHAKMIPIHSHHDLFQDEYCSKQFSKYFEDTHWEKDEEVRRNNTRETMEPT